MLEKYKIRLAEVCTDPEGRLSFRDADVVRGNEEYEKGYEGGGVGVIIGTGKGGRGNSTVFMPATLWSQHKKSGS